MNISATCAGILSRIPGASVPKKPPNIHNMAIQKNSVGPEGIWVIVHAWLYGVFLIYKKKQKNNAWLYGVFLIYKK